MALFAQESKKNLSRGLLMRPRSGLFSERDIGPDEDSQLPEDAGLPSVSREMLLSDSAGIGGGLQQESANKRGLFGGLFGRKNNSENFQDDIDKKYGLSRPEEPKEGVISKIADYAIPALASYGAGQGVAPGLLMGYYGNKRKKEDRYKTGIENYRMGRKEAIGQEKEYRTLKRQEERDKALDKYRNDSLDAIAGYRDRTAGIAERRIGIAEENSKRQSAIAQNKIVESKQNIDLVKNNIKEMANSLKEEMSGPIMGRLGLVKKGIFGDEGIAKYQALQATTLSNLARLSGEKGVLTDQDVNRIMNAIPRPEDTTEEQEIKFKTINDILSTRMRQFEELNQNLNMDIGRDDFQSIPDDEWEAEALRRGMK